MLKNPLPRIDKDEELRGLLRKYCRIGEGEIWRDPEGRHSIGCFDCADEKKILELVGNEKPTLAVHDPPYNIVAFEKRSAQKFAEWSKKWIDITNKILSDNSSLYVWLGADQNNHFEPFAEFILMMKETGFDSRSFITMRNQRGYGTQKNWMAVRQELLYYVKGNPAFNIEKVYTDIPKILRGYYKEVKGKITENFERSKSDKIRAGNVWVDIQQVFHLMEENVNGCYAQKPLKAIERIIEVSSAPNDSAIDFFSHAGTTTLAAEIKERRSFAVDIEPVFCEISIRRLERFRKTGKTGWQNSNPFEEEIRTDKKLRDYLNSKK